VAVRREIDALLARPPGEQELRLRNSPDLWKPEVARLLVREAYRLRFRAPDELIRLASLALFVSERLPAGPGRSDATAESLCALANGHKITGRYGAAEVALSAAAREERTGSGALAVRALRLETAASLRIRQCRTAEARTLLAAAAEIRSQTGDKTALAVTLIQRTLLACEGDAPGLEGVRDARQAAELLDVQREPLLALIARHNGLWALCKMGRGLDAAEVFRAVRPLYFAVDEPLMRLRQAWMAAIIESTLGRFERAAEGFGALVETLLAVPQPYDAAWAALEEAKARASAGMDVSTAVERGLAILRALGIGETSMAARLLSRAAMDKRSAVRLRAAEEMLRQKGLRYGLQPP
jgi:hypothetical protein